MRSLDAVNSLPSTQVAFEMIRWTIVSETFVTFVVVCVNEVDDENEADVVWQLEAVPTVKGCNAVDCASSSCVISAFDCLS